MSLLKNDPAIADLYTFHNQKANTLLCEELAYSHEIVLICGKVLFLANVP